MVAGFALLFALSALAAFAALAVTVRARPRGRAETLLAATLLWNALVVAPIYAVGLTNRLTARSVAVGVLVASLVALALSSLGVGPRALARDVGRSAWRLARLPFDGLAEAWSARSFVFLGVLFAAVLLPYLALSAYLGQPKPQWDPLWYHDTMVGLTIQNHGFRMVELPETLQKVNGYVRLGEMTQLWLVIFGDRRLADLTNVLFAPAIVAGTYLFSRRHTDRVTALGWGVGAVLMPACCMYLHSTYVDPQNAALVIGGIYYATLERPRLRDGALSSLGLALAIGSKGLALVSVPVTGLVAAVHLLRAHRGARRRAAFAVIAGGVLLIAGTASTTYWRNYKAFHNPFWPDMSVELPSLGIHWPGMGPWAPDEPGRKGLPVNLNEPLPKLLDHLYALPWSVKGMFFDQAVEYGIGIVWVAVPLGAIAFLSVLSASLRRRFGQGDPTEPAPPLSVALILAAMVAGSPALWGPRYHTAHVALMFSLVAWLTRRPGWQRLSEPAVSMVAVTSLMMFWWTPTPRWWFTPERMVELWRAPPAHRELDRDLGAPTLLTVGLAREKELKPGSLFVFNERYSGFPSLFWNNTYSSRVKYVKGGAGFLSRAAQEGATWISIDQNDPNIHQARAAGSGWQEVGVLNPINRGYAFRRVPVPPPPPPPPPPKAPPPPPPAAAPAKAKPTKPARQPKRRRRAP